MPRLRLAAVLLFAASTVPAATEAPMTAEEFEARTTGRTLVYASDGVPYGMEEYLDDRRVRWAFLDGECQDGSWYAAGDMICFVYDDPSDPQCWTFYDRPGGLRALYMNDPAATELVEIGRSTQPLVCRGPDVGV